ncbi:MAG: hypothetical protein CUN57_03195, partial [Phototrophicales bacterium]
ILRQRAGQNVLAIDVYIDNLLVLCPDYEAAKACSTQFFDICDHYGVIIGEHEVGAVVSHRGITLDFHNHRVRLKESFVQKVIRQSSSVNVMTIKALQKRLGRVVYGLSVLGERLTCLFHV